MIKRVYHPIDKWEEIPANMWGEVVNADWYLEQAVSLTSNSALYGFYMVRVVFEWRFSCENALTDRHINQKAWLGHAAVALAINCPEDITRKAWKFLTEEQQNAANKEAERAIIIWKNKYLQKPLEKSLL